MQSFRKRSGELFKATLPKLPIKSMILQNYNLIGKYWWP